jgi:hypothetical protein
VQGGKGFSSWLLGFFRLLEAQISEEKMGQKNNRMNTKKTLR